MATILADYDSDQQFPAFGFGAKSPQFGGVSHCFPLNFNHGAPEVIGVQVGIVQNKCYSVCLSVCLSVYYDINVGHIGRLLLHSQSSGFLWTNQLFLHLRQDHRVLSTCNTD